MEVEDPKTFPFYERIVDHFLPGIFGRIFFALLLGLAFFAAHYFIGIRVITPPVDWSTDWSWFLALLITTAMLCLYYATYTLRGILPEMALLIKQKDDDASAQDTEYKSNLDKSLANRNFILTGLSFGIINSCFGVIFGLPYHHPHVFAKYTVMIGYFLAGFICGMAVWGIYAVSVSITTFIRKSEPPIDFTSPDSCGGISFLGEAIIIFASVTLIVGVMISIYILKTDWSQGNSEWWIVSLKWFWITFPYVISLVALLVPAAPINKRLKDYKMTEEDKLNTRLANIRKELNAKSTPPITDDQRETLHKQYNFQEKRRADLHKMLTWPFKLRANLKYLIVFVINLYITLTQATEWEWLAKFIQENT